MQNLETALFLKPDDLIQIGLHLEFKMDIDLEKPASTLDRLVPRYRLDKPGPMNPLLGNHQDYLGHSNQEEDRITRVTWQNRDQHRPDPELVEIKYPSGTQPAAPPRRTDHYQTAKTFH